MWKDVKVLLFLLLSISSLGYQEETKEKNRIKREYGNSLPSNQCQLRSGEIGTCQSSAACLRERLIAVLTGAKNFYSSDLERCSYESNDGQILQGSCCSGAFETPYVVTVNVPSPPLGSASAVFGTYPVSGGSKDSPQATVVHSAAAVADSHGVSSSAGAHVLLPGAIQSFPGFPSGIQPVITGKQPDPSSAANASDGSSGPWIQGVNWPPPIPTHPPDHTAPTHPPGHTIPPLPTHPPGLFPTLPEQTQRPPSPPSPPAPPAPPEPPTAPTLPPQQTQPQPFPPLILPPGISQWPPPLPTHPPLPIQTPPTPIQPIPGPVPGPSPGPSPFPQPPTEIGGTGSCGTKKQIGLGFKIVGGKEAGKHEWRWMVAMFLERFGRRHLLCGGSLIDAYHVLTAAHCLKNISPYQLTLQIGDHDISSTTEARHITVKVASFTIHSGYNEFNNQNDIAMIRLASKVTFTENIIPICLPTPDEMRDFAGEVATVAGWGSLSYGQAPSTILYNVELSIWKNADCDQAFTRFFTSPGHIAPSMICAGQFAKDSCTGDSGGPLMIEKDGRWIQIGVVSWGIQCGSQPLPGVYTRVTSFLDWVELNRT